MRLYFQVNVVPAQKRDSLPNVTIQVEGLPKVIQRFWTRKSTDIQKNTYIRLQHWSESVLRMFDEQEHRKIFLSTYEEPSMRIDLLRVVYEPRQRGTSIMKLAYSLSCRK